MIKNLAALKAQDQSPCYSASHYLFILLAFYADELPTLPRIYWLELCGQLSGPDRMVVDLERALYATERRISGQEAGSPRGSRPVKVHDGRSERKRRSQRQQDAVKVKEEKEEQHAKRTQAQDGHSL
jgi:hypothetical protein